MSNAFEAEGPAVSDRTRDEAPDGAGLSATSWTGAAGGGSADGEAPNLEAYVAERPESPRASRRAAGARLRRSASSTHRPGDHRRDRRDRLSARGPRRDRRAPRRRQSGSRGACSRSSRPSTLPASARAIWPNVLRSNSRSATATTRRCRRSSPICRSSRAAISRSSPSCAASTTKTLRTWRRSCAGSSPSPAGPSAARRSSRSSPT